MQQVNIALKMIISLILFTQTLNITACSQKFFDEHYEIPTAPNQDPIVVPAPVVQPSQDQA